MANDEVARLKAELAALKGELEEVDETFEEVDWDLKTTKAECSELKEDLACALAVAGNQGDTAFDGAGIKVLHRLIRFAHERGDTKVATLIAKGACGTLKRARANRCQRLIGNRCDRECNAETLMLRYLAPLKDKHTSKLVSVFVDDFRYRDGRKFCMDELGFYAMHHLMRALPPDQHEHVEPQDVEFSVPNLQRLPVEMPWQQSGGVKWQLSIQSNGENTKLWLGFRVAKGDRCYALARATATSHPELGWSMAVSVSSSRCYFANVDGDDLNLGSCIAEDVVPRDETFTFKARFYPLQHRSRWFLLNDFLGSPRSHAGAVRTLEYALGDDVGSAAAEAAAAGCDNAAVNFVRDVALRDCAHHFIDLAADEAFTSLSASALRRLLERDELNTETEEETLLALSPWLSAEDRQASDVAGALGSLRWAWLPRKAIMQLEADGGMLAPWAQEPCIQQLLETALESHCVAKSNLKRGREEEEELTCPITQVLFEEPVFAADGHTYERAAIKAHFDTGKETSPLTNEQLPNTTLTPNRMVKKQVCALRERTQRCGLRKRSRFAASPPAAGAAHGSQSQPQPQPESEALNPCVREIFGGTKPSGPVVQINDMKTTGGGRVKATISDGAHFGPALFGSAVVAMVERGEIKVSSTIRLREYTANKFAGTMLCLVMGCEHVADHEEKIGEPVSWDVRGPADEVANNAYIAAID